MAIGWYEPVVDQGTFLGGESRDALVDGGAHVGSAPTGWSIVGSPVYTGAGAWQCDADGAHDSTVGISIWGMASAGSAALLAFEMWVYLSGSPSSAGCLIGSDLDSGICVEVGTDRKLRIVQLGTAPNRWSGRTARTGWTTNALPSADWGHVVYLSDGLTNAGDCFHVLLLDYDKDGTYEDELTWNDSPSSTSHSVGPVPNIDNVDLGITITIDDCVGLRSDTAGDAPHLTAWPLAVVNRQLATGDGATETDFYDTGGSPGDGDGTYTEWDDTTGNDGDTTYNAEDASGGANLQQASTGQNAAAVGVTGHTVLHKYSDATEGPWLNIVSKNADSDTKFGGKGYNSLGTNPTLAEPGGVYTGAKAAFPQSGGWAVGDLATLEFGVEIPQGAAHNQEWRVTLCMMQWLTYTATLPTTTTPPGAAARRRFGMVP